MKPKARDKVKSELRLDGSIANLALLRNPNPPPIKVHSWPWVTHFYFPQLFSIRALVDFSPSFQTLFWLGVVFCFVFFFFFQGLCVRAWTEQGHWTFIRGGEFFLHWIDTQEQPVRWFCIQGAWHRHCGRWTTCRRKMFPPTLRAGDLDIDIMI